MNPARPEPEPMDAATGRWLVERYEELRSQRGAEHGGTQGRWVLMTRGMAEWARVCASYVDIAPQAGEREVASNGDGSAVGWQAGEAAELVRMWAQMVWRVEQEGAR